MASGAKLATLNVVLLAGLAAVGWHARNVWRESQAERRATVNVPVKYLTPPPATPAPKPASVQSAKYADVASNDPLSKDRNPNVTIEPPKEAPKVMPPLPVVYGVLGLPSGVRAIMADRSGAASKSVRAGDTVGEFTVLALDTRKVSFRWEDRTIDRNIEDLIDRTGAGPGGGSAGPAVPSAGPAAPPPGPAVAQQPTSASLGRDISSSDGPVKACKPGDNSPVGSVVDGYRKTGVDSPFGTMNCRWVQVK